MNIKSYTSTVLFTAFALVCQGASAQSLNHSATRSLLIDTKETTYIANADFTFKKTPDVNYTSNNKVISLKENTSVRSLYKSSEQYVFDNLKTLKTFFVVADIYFDLDKSAVRPDAIPVLDNLVNLMMEHPEISLATTSFSDTRFAKYNEKLALSRAQAANNYLISKGISTDRLSIVKHGRPQISNPCNNDPSCSLATQQLNRKTEFNIVYNGVNLGQIN